MRPKLVFWRSVVHDVDLGYVEYVLNNWGNEIIVVSDFSRTQQQNSIGWQDIHSENLKNIVLEQYSPSKRESLIDSIIDDNSDAVHVFCGMRGKQGEHLKRYISLCKNPRAIINCEIPTLSGNALELPLRKLYFDRVYSKLCRQYSEKVSCFLALSHRGKQIYESYGWQSDKVYPFMYCPKMPVVTNTCKSDGTVRFVYVGRLDVQFKGLDNLMKAFDMQKSSNYTLDLYGGYGDAQNRVMRWAKDKKNVHCHGTVDFSTMCKTLGEYDVCVVPSHYDGWNMTPNMALNASCATIVTNRATSDELIKFSNSGIVVPDSPTAIMKAVQRLCENTDELENFKQNASEYRHKISGENVGRYFIDILDYTFQLRHTDKPVCPWT